MVLYNICHPHFHLLLLPVQPFASVWIASIQADHTWAASSADFHKARLSSTHLMTLAQLVAPITGEDMWRKAVQERDNRIAKGDKVPLGDNRGATGGKFYSRR